MSQVRVYGPAAAPSVPISGIDASGTPNPVAVPVAVNVDASGNPATNPNVYASGNVANAAASAVIPATPGKTGYLAGFDVWFAGATAASVVLLTVTGLGGGGTITLPVAVPAGVTVGGAPISVRFPVPLAASAPNTAITVSLPALGAGNTNAAVNAYGYVA